MVSLEALSLQIRQQWQLLSPSVTTAHLHCCPTSGQGCSLHPLLHPPVLPGAPADSRWTCRLCEMPSIVHMGFFCATHLVCKDDSCLVESLAPVTQGVFYFFWAVLGIYKWSFYVRCQNELHLCNPRSRKGIQKINFGIFSIGLLLESSKTDPETLVCFNCLGLTFLFWARLLGTSV